MKQIKKLYTRIINLKSNFICSIIYYVYYHLPIINNLVYIESKGGEDLAGNMLRISEELKKPIYGNIKLVFYVKSEYRKRIKILLKNYNIRPYKIVSNSISAGIAMERAKYLFTDADLRKTYVKRDGQVLVNTWHGTPQKYMGRKNVSEKLGVGTLQRMNILSDYLVFPNRYMGEIMMQDYMIANISPAKILWEGYPRNCIFFNRERRFELIEKFFLKDKKIYIYMPTYRGAWWAKDKSTQINTIINYLDDLDSKMQDDQVLFVKLHLYGTGKIDYSSYKHIREFPVGYETYDILNMADCLITDYSSVFFDFANTRRKIILFTYDEEEYFKSRGVYCQLSEFPFPNVKTVDELVHEMETTEVNYDCEAFLQKFCTFDRKDATERLCRHILLGDKCCVEDTLSNGKENVLIFGGSFNKNGITFALLNVLKNIDKEKRNYILVLRKDDINRAPQKLEMIPENIDYLIMDHSVNRTLVERFKSQRFSKNRDINAEIPKELRRLYLREWNSYYKNVDFAHLVQFDGYGIDINLMFLQQQTHKIIFVHNDMMREISMKSWQHPATLRQCYKGYDLVGVVSEDLIEPTALIAQRKDNIIVINNYHNTTEICEKGDLPIEFQKETELYCMNPKGIEGLLNTSGPKFISIGRFAHEKGHIMLLNSFNRFWNDNPDAILIIVGGYGSLYEHTVKKAKSLPCWRNIAIIKSLENPMPILKQCDLFILSSIYEGLPLTIKEAETLGIPVLSTTLPSIQQFAKVNCLYQVQTSETGLYQGMVDYIKGRIDIMGIDFNAYNKKALEEFERIFRE